jgi:uncharacterized metal-binding protein YceD (DUF177 family)
MPKQIDTPTIAPAHGLRRLVPIARIGEAGLAVAVTTLPDELAKVAAYLELESIQSLKAEVELSRWRDKGVMLTGHFVAEVTQSCVVTLEPVDAHVEGDFERRYLPNAELTGGETATHEIHVDPDGEDPAETLGREIDLGEILVEELSLALDPYPRKPGVEFTPEQDKVAKPDNPFAVLAKLKGKGGKGKGKP